MALYNTGSVTVKVGSASVKGNSTNFMTYVSAGNTFKLTGESTTYTIAAINSATRLTLSSRYANSSYQTNRTAETLATSFTATELFSGTTDYYPVIQNYFIVTASPGNIVFTESGGGTLTGTPVGSGTIDYDTGAWTLDLATTLATPITITASYFSGDTRTAIQYQILRDYTPHYNIPEINVGDANFQHIYTRAVNIIDSALFTASMDTCTVAATLIANTASINSSVSVGGNLTTTATTNSGYVSSTNYYKLGNKYIFGGDLNTGASIVGLATSLVGDMSNAKGSLYMGDGYIWVFAASNIATIAGGLGL